MSSFAPASASGPPAKKMKGEGAGLEFFPGIGKVEYEGPDSDNPLAFKWYNPEEVIMGRPMKEWLRFSCCFWHTFRGTGADPFGFPTMEREWDDGTASMDNYKRRLRANFEFLSKMQIDFWCFHDRDIAPEGKTHKETVDNLAEITDLAAQLQRETGKKCLWGTANLFAAPMFMNGASTNPNFHNYAAAATQVKCAIDATYKLGGANFVFWNGRDGFQSALNTDMKKELDHAAALYRMVIAYVDKIGFKGQLLIEPKPREPMKHQYDYDTQTTIGFLRTYDLHDRFKINIEPNHTTLAGHDHAFDIQMASQYGMLGSVDCNTGDPMLGWDTDQFPMDVKNTTLVMKAVLEQGGLAPGGLNFDCKLRRESTDLADMFIGHIGGMDTYARGLRCAARILEDNKLPKMVSDRYATWQSDLGQKTERGEATLEELEKHVAAAGPAPVESGKQELFEMIYNKYT